MPGNQPDYESIRKRIKARYQRRVVLIAHIVLFAVFNASLWYLMPQLFGRWPLIVIDALWVVIGLILLIRMLFNEAQERAIQDELERQWRIYGNAENDAIYDERTMRLADDGELVEFVEDAWEGKRKREI
jgi:hypothetical protein